MTRQVVNVGTNENDGTGDKLRVAMTKINENFEEVYSLTAGETNIDFTPNTISSTNTNGNLTLVPNGTGTLIVSSGIIVNSDAQSDESAQLIMKDSTDADMLIVDPLTKSVSINTTSATSGLFVVGNASITGSNVALAANVSLGASETNVITVTGKIGSSIAANVDGVYDIGTAMAKFGTAYLSGVESTAGNITTLGTNTITAETVTSTYGTIGDLTISGTLIDLDTDVLSVAATVSSRAYKGTVTRETLSAPIALAHPLNFVYSYSPSGAGLQVELDTASGHTGGPIFFINRSGSNAYSVLAPDSSVVATVSANGTARVISDGVSWFQV